MSSRFVFAAASPRRRHLLPFGRPMDDTGGVRLSLILHVVFFFGVYFLIHSSTSFSVGLITWYTARFLAHAVGTFFVDRFVFGSAGSAHPIAGRGWQSFLNRKYAAWGVN